MKTAHDGIGKPFEGIWPFCSECGSQKINVGLYCYDANTGKPSFVGQCPECKCSVGHAWGRDSHQGFFRGTWHTCFTCGREERCGYYD